MPEFCWRNPRGVCGLIPVACKIKAALIIQHPAVTVVGLKTAGVTISLNAEF
jgi:hypothetical protein